MHVVSFKTVNTEAFTKKEEISRLVEKN